jgi:hypothetical protein
VEARPGHAARRRHPHHATDRRRRREHRAEDSATLAGELLAAARGEESLIDAVATYERVMLPRGFDTVDNALRMADQMFGKTD